MYCLKLCSLCVLVVLSNAMGDSQNIRFIIILSIFIPFTSPFYNIFFYLLFVGWQLLEIIFLNINPFAFLI